MHLDRARKILKDSTLSVTLPRLAILEIFYSHHGPFTAEEIFQQTAKVCDCDLATIYRTINIYCERELLKKCYLQDGLVRYELEDKDHHHHHITCKKCRKSELLDDCFLAEVEAKLSAQGYTSIEHQLEYFGICRACQSL